MTTLQTPLTEAFYYILLSLCKPLHGYGVIQQVKEMSGGRVELGAGTLYGAIKTLSEKGWIEPFSDDSHDRRKNYKITKTGREALDLEIKRLEELLHNAKTIKEYRS